MDAAKKKTNKWRFFRREDKENEEMMIQVRLEEFIFTKIFTLSNCHRLPITLRWDGFSQFPVVPVQHPVFHIVDHTIVV